MRPNQNYLLVADILEQKIASVVVLIAEVITESYYNNLSCSKIYKVRLVQTSLLLISLIKV